MLLPQFTLRKLLALVFVCGLACLIAAAAARGQFWAAGATVALFGVGVVLAVYGVMFGVVWCVGKVLGRRARSRLASPARD